MVYKTNESIIVIQAEATSPNRTNVVFWSHDRGTAKLRMKLVRKNGIPQSLPEGTTVPIRLMFKSATAEGGYGKHDYLATIEDRVNGIVSIVLEDNILGYVGTVEGSVYIDFPNDRSLDTAGRFTFYIKRSPIDDSTPELEDYYFNGFSQTIDKIEKILADGKLEIEQKIAESETQIDAKLKDTNDKITKANQDVATLNTNIDKANDRIDQTNQQIGELRNDMKLSEAWAWSKDGTDRFTTVYPGENYSKNSRITLELSNVTNNRNQLNGDVPHNLADLAGKTVTISVEIEVKNAQPQTSGSGFRIGCEATIPRASGETFYLGVWENLSAGQTIATKRISRTLSIPNDIVATHAEGLHLYVQANGDYFRVSKPKIELGDTPTIYTPAPSEDYANAYPTYKGISIVDSNNPNDYSWDIMPEYTEKGLNDSVSLTEPETILGLKNFAEGLQLSGVNVAVEYAKAIDTDKYTKHGAIYLGGCAWLAWETLTFQKTEGYAKGSYIRLGTDGNASFTYSDVPNIFGGYLWLGGVCQPDYTDGGFGSYHITVENNFDDARKPIVRFIDSPSTPVKKLAVRGFALVFAPAPTENSQVKE
ncbi:BppU family phage baseplate upper protein [Enterococcus faecium]|uniref:BppU family phage baseplate upper protein n=1 Tax=Enterococcus faecium TaxID=1352 RepID=UPI0035E2E51E